MQLRTRAYSYSRGAINIFIRLRAVAACDELIGGVHEPRLGTLFQAFNNSCSIYVAIRRSALYLAARWSIW